MTSLERVGRHHPDETGVIMSFLSSQDIARLMQAQNKSLSKECLAANVRTLPDHMLVPCERYSKHAGNAELLHRVRTERDRRAEVHTPGFMATKTSIAKRRIDREVAKWVDKLYWPRWNRQHAEMVFQTYLNPIDFEAFKRYEINLHAVRNVPYYVAEALWKMFVMGNRRDLLPLIPYLKLDPRWAELATLLVGRRMDTSIAKWVKFVKSRSRELREMFAASSDAEKLTLARSLTSHDDTRLLCDIATNPQPWMMQVPRIVRCMTRSILLWPRWWSTSDIATFASWLLINPETHARDGENPSGLPALQAENVAAFEAILRHRPEVARSDRIASAVHALQSNVTPAGAQRALLQRVLRAVGSTRAAGSG
jgi:hypothetical protein